MENTIQQIREELLTLHNKQQEIIEAYRVFTRLFDHTSSDYCARCCNYKSKHGINTHKFVSRIDLSTLQKSHIVYESESVKVEISSNGLGVYKFKYGSYEQDIYNNLNTIAANILTAIESERLELEKYNPALRKLEAFVSLFEVENKNE